MELVSIDNAATWVNHPEPPLEEWKHTELLSIGGTNIYGQPNLRWAWGQTRMQFRINRERLLYVDMRLPAVEHRRYTFKKLLLVKTERVHVRTDPTTGEMFFEERDASTYDRLILDHPPGPGDIIPPGYIYDEEYPELEWIGEQMFFLEQFVPPEHILGGPTAWEAERYGMGINPDTGVEEMLDWLGPFPAEGRYESQDVIGQPCEYIEYVEEPVVEERGYRLVTRRVAGGQMATVREPLLYATGQFERKPKIREHLLYKEPDEDTFTEIRRRWASRNNETLAPAAVRSGLRFYEYNRTLEKRNKQQREENRNAVAENLRAQLGMQCGNRAFFNNLDGMGIAPIGAAALGDGAPAPSGAARHTGMNRQTKLNRRDRRRQESLDRRRRVAA